jgi:hypothetical protein
MSESPLPNGGNGQRQTGGRFAPGNPGGPGNPYARQVAALRAALLNAVTPDDMAAIVARLIADAKAGSVASAREVIERTLGKPQEADLIERIERIETLLASEANR